MPKKSFVILFLMCIGLMCISAQIFVMAVEVPKSPYYPNSNIDWWQYQFDNYPDYTNHNCGPACSAMLINYLKGKGVTTTYYSSISSAYPEVHCYARWDYCKANGHSNGYDNSDWSSPGATTEQIISALSSESIQIHTFTGYDCCNDGRGITNLQNAIDQGKVCICLVDPSRYRDTDCHSHWVVAYGYDSNYIYLNDPGYITGEGFPASNSDFADALWDVTELSTVIVSDSTIYNYPTVDSFSVTPTSITLGDSFNISYTVSDDIGLQQTELWRVNDVGGEPGDWNTSYNPIFTKVLSGQKNYSGSFTDTPDTTDTYWYGMHVVDTSGNWSVEPNPPGPIVVTVINPTPTIYVPDDYSTIQAAVNAASSGDTIIVRDGTYDESITFPSGKVIVLQSLNSPSSTIIRGSNGSPTVIFDGSLEGTSLDGFTIMHENENNGNGIYISNGYLTIKNCDISNNRASSNGAGINNNGTLTLTNNTISNNYTKYDGKYDGAGIYNTGYLTMYENVISNNFSSNNGGGIYNSGYLTIMNSNIQECSSSFLGGGITNTGLLDIKDSVILHNFGYFAGGGIYNIGNLTIFGSDIIDNSVSERHGGGIYNIGSDAILTISESTISDNSASWGGGINNHEGTINITKCFISRNYAKVYGGGIENSGLANITRSNIFDNNADLDGGGIYLLDLGNSIIGGSNESDKNTLCGNYKDGDSPSLDQQISDSSGSLYETYMDTNYISAYCTEDNPPTIEITSPSDGETVSGTVRFSTYAIDDYGLDKVEFYIDDELKVSDGPFGPDTGSTCNWDCDTTPGSIDYIPDGSHVFIAKAYDNTGQIAVDTISFVVDNVVENQSPVANAGVNQTVHSGQVVWFDGSNSSDPDGTIVSYKWDFGDGGIATGCHANHRFRGAMNESKTYAVTLTVEDNSGTTATDSCDITVMPLEKPVKVIHQPSVPIPGVTVFAKMEVSYNWVDEISGEDIYIVSRVDCSSDGFAGIYTFNFIDKHSRANPWTTPTIHPLLWWNLLLCRGTSEKTYGKDDFKDFEFFKEKAYGKDFFEGIEVYAYDIMYITAYGYAGIQVGYVTPFFERNSTYFRPESTEVPTVPIDINDLNLVHLCSPGELRVYDPEGRVTGLVNEEIKEEIPYSAYNDNTVIILSPVDSYRYKVVGTDEGSYGLGVDSVEDGEVTTFTATDIPTTSRAVHQYTIDWDALSRGEEGVTVQVDSDGDGKFEDTFTSDDELTQEDFLEETSPPPPPAVILGDFGSANGGPPDCIVDFEDLMIFALAYGSAPADSNWNVLCDIASQGGVLQPDGIIDFEDLMVFAMHYGETCADL